MLEYSQQRTAETGNMLVIGLSEQIKELLEEKDTVLVI